MLSVSVFKTNSQDILQILLGLIIALLMLGLGSTTQIEEFKHQVYNWPAPLIGFLCQVVLMPLLSFAFAEAFGMSDAISLSIIAIGSTPGGSTSNLFTKWSKGDLPLSITMTVCSTVLSFGTLPGLLALYGSRYTSDDLQIPFGTVAQSLLLVVVPVSIGIAVRYYSAYWAIWCERIGTAAGIIFIIAAMIFGSITEQSIWNAPAGSYVIGVLLLLTGACLGYFLSWMFKFPRRQARTIALETGIQNSVLTIAILTLSFPVKDGAEEEASRELQQEILQFPLLYSVFLIFDSLLLTGIFYFVAEWDPEEEKAAAKAYEKAHQEASEREINGGKTNAEMEEEKEAKELEEGGAAGASADKADDVEEGGGEKKQQGQADGGDGIGAASATPSKKDEDTAIAKSKSGIAPTGTD